jgi:hypothetical protein
MPQGHFRELRFRCASAKRPFAFPILHYVVFQQPSIWLVGMLLRAKGHPALVQIHIEGPLIDNVKQDWHTVAVPWYVEERQRVWLHSGICLWHTPGE